MTTGAQWIAAYNWCKKWMVHIWLGIPLLSGVIGCSAHQDQYADIYQVAQHAPRFVLEGTIDRPDMRGEKLRIKTTESKRQIYCSLNNTSSSCLFGHHFPFKAKVTLFDYKGRWIIIEVSQLDGTVIVSKDRQIESLESYGNIYKRNDRYRSTLWGITIGLLMTPIGIVPLGALRIILWRKEKDKIKNLL